MSIAFTVKAFVLERVRAVRFSLRASAGDDAIGGKCGGAVNGSNKSWSYDGGAGEDGLGKNLIKD